MDDAKRILSKAKWGMLNKYPFFAYLLDACVITLTTEVKTAGVDAGKNMYINPEWIKKLSNDQISGLLAHEVMHKALEHFKRMPIEKYPVQVQNGYLSNIAQDIVINNMLVRNDMALPDEGYLPSGNSITIGDIVVDEISTKSAEEIYHELKNQIPEEKDSKSGKGKGKSGKSQQQISGDSFDEHIYENGDQSSESTAKDAQSQEKDWGKLLNEAAVYARHCGTLPAGMEEILNVINKPKIKWKSYLRKVVAANIPRDYSWKKPNKKYLWQECYMPSSQGDAVSVVISFDTSASVSKEELDQYVSEVVGISKAYSSIDFRILTHDVEVHDDIQIKDSNKKHLKKISVHGRGGTSHVPLYEYIKEKKYNTVKLLISFTDGFSDYPEKPSIPTVFVLSGQHIAKNQMPKWAVKVLSLSE